MTAGREWLRMPRGRVPGSTNPQVWFWPFVDVRGPNECWEWGRTQTPKGYGHVFDRRLRRYVGAHRVALADSLGTTPDQLRIVRHSCDNPPCCNPGHLRDGTQKDNQMDMAQKHRGAMQKKTHCVHDHPLSGDNIRINSRGERVCLTCDHATQARARARRRQSK